MVKRAPTRQRPRKVKPVAKDVAPRERERMRSGQPRKILPVAKLPLEHLRSLLSHLPRHHPRLLIGSQIGEDAAVIDAGDRYLVVTTDPITFATDHIGRYVVHINANDIAVMGAAPALAQQGSEIAGRLLSDATRGFANEVTKQ